MCFLTSNNYIYTATEKAFIEGVSGCTEHHIKLHVVGHPRCKKNPTQHHRVLVGSGKCIWIHTPQLYLLRLVALPPARPLHSNHPILVHMHMYRPKCCDLHWTVGDTASASGKRIVPGWPTLSCHFDVITNPNLDTIMSQCSHAEYRYSNSLHRMPILQCTDGTYLAAC